MDPSETRSLWTMARAAGLNGRFLGSPSVDVTLCSLDAGSSIDGDLSVLKGRSVLVATDGQLAAAVALLELDGLVRRLVLCPPDLPTESIPAIMEGADIDAIVSDREEGFFPGNRNLTVLRCGTVIEKPDLQRDAPFETEWVLFTSGTTGLPKMAVHRLFGLTGAINRSGAGTPSSVWGTFYDMRRYGGLQIFLRALLGNSSFLLSSAAEALSDHLERLAEYRVTHLSGTPSHWRRVLMNASAHKIAPSYVRLSGEIADQGILDGLRALYPEARIAHAYASTEAGVGFEVNDGQEGFPASFIGQSGGGVEFKVEDGSLRVRSHRAALRYLSATACRIEKDDGFIDTGDLVELRGGRYHFIGRKDGVINVGGQKVHPEEVEAVINRHPRVRMSLVRARKNSIIGSVVVADIVPEEVFRENGAGEASWGDLENEVRNICAHHLARYKVPALIRFVSSLAMTSGGKLARPNA